MLVPETSLSPILQRHMVCASSSRTDGAVYGAVKVWLLSCSVCAATQRAVVILSSLTLLLAMARCSHSAMWLGVTLQLGVAPAANVVTMYQLNDDGSQKAALGSVAIGNMTMEDDAFRCEP